jgi:putative ABC transport system substrate-binding protein
MKKVVSGQLSGISKSVLALALCAMLFAICPTAWAEQANKLSRIGFLSSLSPSSISARTEAFRQGLRELGYVEGKNILIEWRYAEGNAGRLKELAAELVRLKVDVIVTGGPAVNRPAKEATATIPIVLSFDNDPVGNGFAASLARPGGNLTGLSTHYPEISGKQLEILKETIPRLARVAVLGNATVPGNAQALREAELAGGALRIKLQYLEIENAKQIESAFQAATRGHADGALVLGSQVVTSNANQFAKLAVKGRLPAMYWSPEFVEAGGLMTYSVSITDLFRRAATYVDKILKGRKPADLPVEQPTKFELVINLKAAKQIDLTIPQSVLARADRVIR